MNKTLFVFILSIILFQYAYNSECTDESSPSTDNCSGKGTSTPSKKCVFVPGEGEEATGTCQEEIKDCAEITAGATDDLCKSLKVTDRESLCIKDDKACNLIKKCNFATGTDDAACKVFPVENKGYICKKDTTKDSTKCKEVKDESTVASSQAGNNLTFSLAFLIFLFLF